MARTGTGSAEVATVGDVRRQVREMMESAWREPGFCVPNPTTYPHQWLWDSCFHAIVWAELGDERAVIELESALANQLGSGFVPHMTYWATPDQDEEFWGRPLTSSITQPPMFGHAVAAILDRGMSIPGDLVDRTSGALRHLVEDRRRSAEGLVPVFHPWETGCDDSLRWDDWCPPGPTGIPGFDVDRWRIGKGQMIAELEHEDGTPVRSRRFEVGSVAFSALVAWNIAEFDRVGLAPGGLAEAGTELAAVVGSRWDADRRTWTDRDSGSGTARTLEAMLGLLVDPRSAAVDDLLDPAAFAAPFGPRGAHGAEPAYRPDEYWRGSTWPQLIYLLSQVDDPRFAAAMSQQLAIGAERSDLAEYWNPESGEGLGASPQTWTGLTIAAGSPPADRPGSLRPRSS